MATIAQLAKKLEQMTKKREAFEAGIESAKNALMALLGMNGSAPSTRGRKAAAPKKGKGKRGKRGPGYVTGQGIIMGLTKPGKTFTPTQARAAFKKAGKSEAGVSVELNKMKKAGLVKNVGRGEWQLKTASELKKEGKDPLPI